MSQMSHPEEKQRDFVKLSLAIIPALALSTLYLYFLIRFLETSSFGQWDLVELVIFYAMIFRVLGLVFVPFLRKLQTQVKIVIISFEDFVLFFLILLLAFTKDQSYVLLLSNVLTSWIGASLLILVPYSIFELARMMYKGTSFVGLVISAAPLLAVGMFLASLVLRTSIFQGLSSLGATGITSLKGQPGFGNGPELGSNLIITASAVVFSVSITLYITITMNRSITKMAGVPKYHYALVLIFAGIVVAYLWVLSTSSLFSGNLVEIFTIPATMIPIILWVMSRGE